VHVRLLFFVESSAVKKQLGVFSTELFSTQI
jgi:hypothetical protein